MAGRFSTLYPEVRDAIVSEVERGAPFHYAYLLAGIPKVTGEKWRTKGHHSIRANVEDEYSELVHLMDMAKAKYMKVIYTRLGKAGETAALWQSDSELLARRCPESFSKNAGVEGEYHDPAASFDKRINKIIEDVESGKITSEEGLRRSQIIQTLIQSKYDSQFEGLREKLLPIFKKMEGK